METGVLVIPNAAAALCVPVFLDSRSIAFSILGEAMAGWQPPGKADPFYERLDFYSYADRLGKERTGARRFRAGVCAVCTGRGHIRRGVRVYGGFFRPGKIVVVK